MTIIAPAGIGATKRRHASTASDTMNNPAPRLLKTAAEVGQSGRVKVVRALNTIRLITPV